MTVAHLVPVEGPAQTRRREVPSEIRAVLLGHGNVGSAITRLAGRVPGDTGHAVRILGALVRDPAARRQHAGVPLTSNPAALLDARPDVLIEVLGGVEPARTILLDALSRRIPVVTANKTLLAEHGAELTDAADRAGVALCYEASVIAGVPFLGTLAQRPLTSQVRALSGIVNGTSNYILSQVNRGTADLASALEDAQRHGFAESEPSKDLEGIDAAEKLAVLLRQFARVVVRPRDLETEGIEGLTAADFARARQFGGTLKPVVHAEWSGTDWSGFVGPAFVRSCNPLAALHGTANGLSLRTVAGDLLFAGPGAGPDVTAATVLDDVLEAVSKRRRPCEYRHDTSAQVPLSTGWFVRLTSPVALPDGADVADLLGSHGVWVRQTSTTEAHHGGQARWLLTYACSRPQIDRALRALSAATGNSTFFIRTLEARHE
jgi:homoserine dehydrogenase